MNKFLQMSAIALAALAFASPSSAVVVYHYSGHHATNSEGSSAYPYVPLHAPMTFDFTVAAPLAANLLNVNITPTVLSWIASGGTLLSTITSSDPNPYAAQVGFRDLIRLSTDAAGDITTYRILVAAAVTLEPTTEAQFLFERLQAASIRSDETFSGYSLIHGGGPFVAATCSGTGACAGSTTFTVLEDSAPVPEPSSWALMLAGLGTMGYAARRQRTGA